MRKEGLQSTVEQIEVEGKLYAKKIATEEGKQELIEQVELFRALPDGLKIHYPKLVSVDLNSKPPFYTMDFYPYPTVRQLLIDTDKTAPFINERLSFVLKFLIEKQHGWRTADVPKGYVEKKYLERAQRRLQHIKQKDPKFAKILENTRVYIADEECQNVLLTIGAINEDKSLLKSLTPNTLCSAHGQTEFGHILVDHEDPSNFILIDPKGINDLLDSYYDFGKLKSCSHGLHDWIEEGLFQFKGIKIDDKETVVESLDFKLPERLLVLMELDNLIDSLLPSLTKTDKDSFHLKALFTESIHLLGSVPFCYGFGNFEKAFACYISGMRSLREFIKLAGIKVKL